MGRQLKDPDWKSGPTYPEPTASEHAINLDPAYDHDGVGVDEEERIDGEALCAVREAYSCRRDGCDASPRKDHVYALSDVSDRVQKAACYAIEYTPEPTIEDVVEYLATHVVIVDYDESPIIGFTFGEDELGYVYPQFTDTYDFGGACYGRVEPSPDVNGYRYGL